MNRENIAHKIPALLYIYLALHGLSYAVKFIWKCKHFILFALSTIFIITNDINKLYLIIERISNLENKRNDFILLLIMVLHFMLRIQFFLKRKNLRILELENGKTLFRCNPIHIIKI